MKKRINKEFEKAAAAIVACTISIMLPAPLSGAGFITALCLTR
jgi:hypothetical protein